METFTSDSSSKMTSKLHIVYEPKPPAYKAVRVWLSDGSRMLGMWTGVKWWSTKGEIKPVKWELEERKKKKTERLRKAMYQARKIELILYGRDKRHSIRGDFFCGRRIRDRAEATRQDMVDLLYRFAINAP